jgi:mRNA-degrading endonuclease toxin of MazEF toxin-antitoxin module
VPVVPPEGGLVEEGFIECENVRVVSKQRIKRPRDRMSESTMQEVEDRVRVLGL